MRTESGTSGTGPIKDYTGSLNNSTDEARLEKIDGLSKSLAEKSYHVSAAALAGKIIDYMLQS